MDRIVSCSWLGVICSISIRYEELLLISLRWYKYIYLVVNGCAVVKHLGKSPAVDCD